MNPKHTVYGLIAAYILLMAVAFRPIKPIPKPVQVRKSAVQIKLERYIKDPYIAEEISKVKGSIYFKKIGWVPKAYWLAAIAKVESDYRPQIKGDKGLSHGLYQIQAHHWGWLGDGIDRQTALCEQILSTLLKKSHAVEKATASYNGSGRKAREYAAKVERVIIDIKKC